MTRRPDRVLLLAALGMLGVLILFGPSLAPRDPLASADPAALRLLPPLSSVPAFVRKDGEPVPIAGRDPDRTGEISSDWTLVGKTVRYRRGPRMREIGVSELALDGSGRPLTTELFFPLGTDGVGRDLLSRMLAGARLSLGIGIGGVLGASLLGGLLGLTGGLGSRTLDALLGRAGDAVLSVPRVVLVMALALLVRPGPLALALLLGLTGWPSLTRLVRAEVRSLAGSDLVAAARAVGAGRWRISLRHLLPHAAATLIVAAGLRVGPFVLLESALSFLGFGVPPPYPSWGNILGEGRGVLVEAWWVTALPGLALCGTVVLLNAAADVLRAALDPPGLRP
jgi:peptide/nickel transport system permease protein